MCPYCIIHYLQIDEKIKIQKSKKYIIQKNKSKTTLNTKNQITTSGVCIL